MYKAVLFFCAFLFSLEAAIYDCFLFFNEDDLLRIHLEELHDSVDFFVIVEANQTFSGRQKEFHFENIKHLYTKFLDKIIYIPISEPIAGDDPWARETFQRNQIMRGLQQCNDNDIIIIGDVDEIVRSRSVPSLTAELENKPISVIGCSCDFYRWFLNRKDPSLWVGPAITTYKILRTSTPNEIRSMRNSYIVQDAGWHFSNMGGLAIFLDKIRSFSHFKECCPEDIEQHPDRLYDWLRTFPLTKIDATYPKYIQENQKYFLEKNFIDTANGSYY